MVDVEKIMQEIRDEIKEKGLDKEILSFESIQPVHSGSGEDSFDYEFFIDNVNKANATCLIELDKPLQGNPVSVFIKRVVRKLTRFYIAPVVSTQAEFNAYVTRSINSIRFYIEEQMNQQEQLGELLKRIDALEAQLKKGGQE